MKKHLAVLMVLLVLLCGCAQRHTTRVMPEMPSVEDPAPTPEPTQEPLPQADGALYGSVGLLEEPTVLVSVYLNDAATGSIWTREARAAARQSVAMAVDWLTEQADSYGVTADISYDDGSDTSPLSYTYSLRSRLRGGVDSEESNAFLNEMDALCATLDTAELRAQYGTDHVGFLLFLPVSGTSFTMAHYAEDGTDFYHEYCCLYRYDAYVSDPEPESPATFAHEILHLFGAPDLYEGSSDPYVDGALTAYVQQTYPDDIMLSTYAEDGSNLYTSIDKVISPLTAYCIGLADNCPELEQFPQLADVEPGVFHYGGSGPQDLWPDSGVVTV